ncbi:hypothetical protein DB346_11485 [Verrucomicrobia bacterium LW23]|nr:hypothetical protein DB346_11485 [Verrucomicrobia bacterium LW23]
MTTPVAIIGFACRLAGAATAAEFWARLNNGLPTEPSAAPGTGMPYTPEEMLAGQFPGQTFAPTFRWPAPLLRQVEIDPTDFGMAPEVARELNSLPLLGMSLVREALQHAGTSNVPSALAASPDDRAGLVLGFTHASESATPATSASPYAAAVAEVMEAPQQVAPSPDENGNDAEGDESDHASATDPDSAIPSGTAVSDNESAVRFIAQAIGLRGLNGAVDSGPSAGLAAIQLAVDELESGRCDIMVAGGVQLLPDAERQAIVDAAGAVALAATQVGPGAPPSPDAAWAHTGRPPEEEGIALVVLKRLSEAVRDGDRIWAVIRGSGSATQTDDAPGRSRILAAAHKAWQGACQGAGIRPDGAEFVEVQSPMPGAEVVPLAWMGWHGLASAAEAAPRCVVATPSPLYGRLGAVAGVCGVIRLALSLHHKLLPTGAFGESARAGGTNHVPATAASQRPPTSSQSLAGMLTGNPPPIVTDAGNPRPWFTVPGRERRAGLWGHNPNNSTHYCFLLEESQPTRVEPVRADSVEIFAFSAKSSRPLISQLKDLDKAFNQGITAQALSQRAIDSRSTFSRQHQNRLVIVSRDARELRRQLRIALDFLPANPAESWALPENIFHGYGPPPGRVAMLFPDVAAAAPGMAANAVCAFPVAFDVMAHTELQTGVESPLLADHIYPWPAPPAMEGHTMSHPRNQPGKGQPTGLASPDTAQPAVTVASLAMLGMLQQFEIDANAVAGAGCGELAALAAAGCFDRATLLFLAAMRARCLTEFHLMHELNEPVAALSIRAPLETIRRVLREERLNLGLRQQQTAWIVFGPRPEVLRAQRICLQRAIVCDELPLSSLPSALQEAPMRSLWNRNVEGLDIAPPRVAVYAPSRSGSMPLPEDSTLLREHLVGQAVESSSLREAIRQLYQDGTRIFLEIGPGTTLTREVREELGEHPHAALSLDAEEAAPQAFTGFPGGMLPLAKALAQLAALGSHVRLELWPGAAHPSLFHDVTQVRPTMPGRLLVPLVVLPAGAVPAPTGRSAGRSRQESRKAANGENGSSGRGAVPVPAQYPGYYAYPTAGAVQVPAGQGAMITPGVPASGTFYVPAGRSTPGIGTSLVPGLPALPASETLYVPPPSLAIAHLPPPLAGPPRDEGDVLLEKEYAAAHETLRQLHAQTAEMFRQFLANQEAAQRAVQELYRSRVQQIEAQRTAAAFAEARAVASEEGLDADSDEGVEAFALEDVVSTNASLSAVASEDEPSLGEVEEGFEGEEDTDEDDFNSDGGSGPGPSSPDDEPECVANVSEDADSEDVTTTAEDSGHEAEMDEREREVVAESVEAPLFQDVVVEDFLDLLAVECEYPREFLDVELTLDQDLGLDAARLEGVWQALLLRHPAAQRPPPAEDIAGAQLGQVAEVLRALNAAQAGVEPGDVEVKDVNATGSIASVQADGDVDALDSKLAGEAGTLDVSPACDVAEPDTAPHEVPASETVVQQQDEPLPAPIMRRRPTGLVGGMVRTSTSGAGGSSAGGGGTGLHLGPRLHLGVAMGLALVTEREISVETHPFLRSHVLKERPVLPLSVGLNWMAEAALRHSPEMTLHGCRNFRALRPVALEEFGESERAMRLRLAAGAAQRKSNGLYEVPVELQSEQEQAYYRATMLLSQAPPPQAPVPTLPNLASHPYPRPVREAMETLLYHGPDLYCIETIHGLGTRGISGTVRAAPEPAAWMAEPASPMWHVDPLLLEGSVQLLMLWSIEHLQAPCLPSRYGGFRVYRAARLQDIYTVEVMIRAHDRTHIACDVYVSDETGRPILMVEDMDCSVDRGYTAAFGKS